MANHPSRKLVLAALIGAVGGACASHPARFADRPAVDAVADDAPIPVPPRRHEVDDFGATDEVVESAVVGALDPRRWPDPGDVNALDEVPRSSWFRPPRTGPARSFAELGPPALPMEPLADPTRGGRGGIVVRDARGRRWELRRDPADRPEMRTAAAAIASRLVRALGYSTPEAHVLDVAPVDLAGPAERAAEVGGFLADGPAAREGRYRVVAVRWPEGVDLGPTPMSGVRLGDPSDLVAHEDRRTLRALDVVATWLKIRRLAPDNLRDVYVGAPGRGHVEHAVVGLEGALGADAVVRVIEPEETESIDESTLRRTLSLGLAPKSEAAPTQTRLPALGAIDAFVAAGDRRRQPPLLPALRCSAADRYWIAKRMLALEPAAIEAALDAGRLSNPEARAELSKILEARRLAVAGDVLAKVTPLEVERFDGRALVLRDEAIVAGFVEARTTRYAVELVDDEGAPLAPQRELAAGGPKTSLALPPEVLRRPYVVARIVAVRSGVRAPRPFEVHLRGGDRGLHVVGLTH